MQATKLRMSALVGAAVVAAVALAAPARAEADVRDKIAEKSRQAMENFDLLEFDDAKKLLDDAVALAKKHQIRDAVVAKVYVNLGIVYFSGFDDADNARAQFIEAVKIDGNVAIDPAYSTGPMAKLLAEAKREAGAASTGTAAMSSPDVDCSKVEGLEHELISEAPAGKPAQVVAFVGGDLKAKKVALFYRPKGVPDFVEADMKSAGGCKFAGEIPAEALRSDVLHYYVAALDAKGHKLDSRGSSGSPNIIEVQQVGAGAFGDDENPLGGKSSSEASSSKGGEVSAKVGPIPGSDKPRLFLALAAGTGGGYVTGETETAQSPVGCCFAPALLHVFPELGYYINPRLAVSLAFRFGFPVGANIMGHATGAPAGLVRVHYALSPGGDGLQVTGALGAGVLRNTVQIQDQDPDMNVDTTASGPVLVGVGASYVRALSGPMKFVAELNSLIAFSAGISEIGSCPGTGCLRPSFGLQLDANLGILFAF